MTEIDEKIIAGWQIAASELGVKFTPNYTIVDVDGETYEYLGLVHNFGSENGVLIGSQHTCQCGNSRESEYFLTLLGDQYAEYKRDLFIETLDDWQWFGSQNDKPKWYSGKPWK